MIFIDLPADLNMEDDQGRNLARLADAIDQGDDAGRGLCLSWALPTPGLGQWWRRSRMALPSSARSVGARRIVLPPWWCPCLVPPDHGSVRRTVLELRRSWCNGKIGVSWCVCCRNRWCALHEKRTSQPTSSPLHFCRRLTLEQPR